MTGGREDGHEGADILALKAHSDSEHIRKRGKKKGRAFRSRGEQAQQRPGDTLEGITHLQGWR